jgi:hypothetical protein
MCRPQTVHECAHGSFVVFGVVAGCSIGTEAETRVGTARLPARCQNLCVCHQPQPSLCRGLRGSGRRRSDHHHRVERCGAAGCLGRGKGCHHPTISHAAHTARVAEYVAELGLIPVDVNADGDKVRENTRPVCDEPLGAVGACDAHHASPW